MTTPVIWLVRTTFLFLHVTFSIFWYLRIENLISFLFYKFNFFV